MVRYLIGFGYSLTLEPRNIYITLYVQFNSTSDVSRYAPEVAMRQQAVCAQSESDSECERDKKEYSHQQKDVLTMLQIAIKLSECCNKCEKSRVNVSLN